MSLAKEEIKKKQKQKKNNNNNKQTFIHALDMYVLAIDVIVIYNRHQVRSIGLALAYGARGCEFDSQWPRSLCSRVKLS